VVVAVAFRPERPNNEHMFRRFTLALIALALLSSLTAASAVAEVACEMDESVSAMHGMQHCPDAAKAHDCAAACPLMCGAVTPQLHKVASPRVTRAHERPLRDLALTSLNDRPDLPPPRTEGVPTVQFS
jgi:hypothetical protein